MADNRDGQRDIRRAEGVDFELAFEYKQRWVEQFLELIEEIPDLESRYYQIDVMNRMLRLNLSGSNDKL